MKMLQFPAKDKALKAAASVVSAAVRLSLSVENFHRQFSGANCLLQVKQGDFRSPVNS
jgi:hypothetical protein